MDPAAGFCLGHTLHTVDAAFVFHLGIGALAADHEADVLHAADPDFLHIHGFHFPVLRLRVMHIHAVDFRGKQRRFIPACTRADFHNDILVIIGILGKQEDFQFLLQFPDAVLGFCLFFFGQFSHLFIFFFLQNCQRVFRSFLTVFILFIGLHDGGKFTLFLHQRLKSFLIVYYIRFCQQMKNLFKSAQRIF